MRQQLTKIVSGFMLAVFFYGTVPREYLHDVFANHHDTVDRIYQKGYVGIGPHHTHCSFLSIDFGAFLSTEKQYLFFETIAHSCKWVLPGYEPCYSRVPHVLSLRGPPATC